MTSKASPAVSPDNFHVSLSSFFTGGSPIVPNTAVKDSSAAKVRGDPTRDGAFDFVAAVAPPSDEESKAASTTTEEKSGDKCEETSSSKSANKDSSTESAKCPKRCRKCRRPRYKKDHNKDIEKSSTEDVNSSAAEQTDSSGKSEAESTEDESARAKESKAQESDSSAKSDTATETTSAETTTNDAATTENEGNTSSVPESSTKTGGDTTDTNAKDGSSKASTDAKSSADEAGWSISEDCLLRALKDGGETWANMCAAMNRSKKELRGRWNIIKDRPVESAPEEEPKTAETAEAESSAVEEDSKTYNMKDRKKTEGKDGKSKSAPPVEKDKGKNKGKGVRNARIAIENKQAKAKAATKPDLLSGEEASSEPSSASSSDIFFGYGSKNKRRQNRYLVKHVYSGLHPPSIEPKPDAYFSKEDCEILASVESKHTQSKWLEIQANFFNVTGKMIPLAAIRDKCENAKSKEPRQGSSRRELAERLMRVERWMSRVSQEEEMEDPES